MDRNSIEALIAVSQDYASAKETLELSRVHSKIKPAFGYHPEQPLPEERETSQLQKLITTYQDDIIAIGEVGLPYYLRKKDSDIAIQPYIDLLELFIKQAAVLDKPIILHAIYEDAPIVCDLLEEYSIKKAHFHWFKGSKTVISRLITNDYFMSVTPDILYEKEIKALVRQVPLANLMVETDGPWPFIGPFKNKITHPLMIHEVIAEIAKLKRMELPIVYKQLYKNTKIFYAL